MSEVDATGSVSLAVLDVSLKTAENVVAAQVELLGTLLEAQGDLLAEMLKLLGVGNQVDLTA